MTRFQLLGAYLLARLSEPSTWRGLCAMGGAVGLVLAPEQIELITSTALGLIGLIGTFAPDANSGQ